jgi:transposase
MQITTIGLDLAKRVFQVHGTDAGGRVTVRRKLQREEVATFFAALPPCLVGLEACATAHHWARLIGAFGHQVRLIPPSYVKPYVRRSKTDAADAAAICEAVGRPSMRFVPVKSAVQQAALVHHRVRDLLVRQRTMSINALRGHFAEFGIIAPVGRHRVVDLINLLQDTGDDDVPPAAREALLSLIAELQALEKRIEAVEAVIMREHRTNAMSRRLASIPGIGPITASAIAATITDPSAFKSGRELAAWIGLVPRQHSSGGKQKLYKSLFDLTDSIFWRFRIRRLLAVVYHLRSVCRERVVTHRGRSASGSCQSNIALDGCGIGCSRPATDQDRSATH